MRELLFDRALYRRRQTRAQASGAQDFLGDRVASELAQRLSLIKRDFTRVLDISARPLPLPPGLGDDLLVHMTLVEAAPAPGLMAVADCAGLPFAPDTFDLVVSGLQLHSVDDVPGVLAQCRQVLKPDGLLLAAMFGGDTLVELKIALAAAESEITGGVSPRIYPFATLRDVGTLLQRAGFTLPVVDRDEIVVRYENPARLMHDLRAMGETNILRARARLPLRRQVLRRAGEIYHEKFSQADGKIPATFEIYHLSGWRAHPSQQQPLRPGTARRQLADVLSQTKSLAP